MKLWTAHLFYRLMARMAQIELPVDAGDFRLMDRRALDALLAMPERNRFLRGMSVWIGFTQTAVPFAREARSAGRTSSTPCASSARGRPASSAPPPAGSTRRSGA